MKQKDSTTFYCFSPPIMVATCIIEAGLFIYTLIRYRISPLTRIVGALLLLLAVFQLCEFHVCRNGGPSAAAWSRVGFMAITLLPPLALHLIARISGRVPRWIVWLAYVTGIFFAILFGLGKGIFISHACGGNYAIFQLKRPIGGLYFGYYYGWLVIGLLVSIYFSLKGEQRIRESLLLQALGYLILLIPVGIVNDIKPATIAGIPSIMCGFAVFYALTLVFGIMPRVTHKTVRGKN